MRLFAVTGKSGLFQQVKMNSELQQLLERWLQ